MNPKLPEFRVKLERVEEGDTAYPVGDNIPYHNYIGQRTKLGGEPDWIQEGGPVDCPTCRRRMVFVAQIDSIENSSASNPHSVDPQSGDQLWMFGDAGMIYVFSCPFCGETFSISQCY